MSSSGRDMNVIPAWLKKLMAETFFSSCGVHQNHKKNKNNTFCLQCCLHICSHCFPSHHSHPLLQVRKCVHHDAVQLDDLEKLIDCSDIQLYTNNGAKVIFLNQRPQSKSCKGIANICCCCYRTLQKPFYFCSLSCKVDYIVHEYGGKKLSDILRFNQPEDTQFAATSSRSNNTDAIANSSRRKGAAQRAPLF